MRHYYYRTIREAADLGQWRPSVVTPSAVQRERVPGVVDALDCLLALWVAQALLDDEIREAGDSLSEEPERYARFVVVPDAVGPDPASGGRT